MGTKTIVAPAAEPLHLDEAKDHLRVTGADDDTRISALLAVARDYAETFTGRALVTRTVDITLDGFPACIEPDFSPLRQVVSISYIDSDGNTQTVAAADYDVDLASDIGRIEPAYGEVWPTPRAVQNAVTVRMVVGYATPISSVDPGTDTITAPGHPYANDEVLRLSNSGGALPAGLALNTDYYVVNASGDDLQLSLTSGGSAVSLTDGGSGQSFLGAVPDAIRHAMLLATAHYFDHREDVVVGTVSGRLPMGSEALLWSYKLPRF